MNKFLNRKVRSVRSSTKHEAIRRRGTAYDVLQEFADCWSSLEVARRKMARSVMYAFEDQWGDYVTDPETGRFITEAELIRKQGKVPLKNNMISPILKNIDGQFRTSATQPVCTVRDRHQRDKGT